MAGMFTNEEAAGSQTAAGTLSDYQFPVLFGLRTSWDLIFTRMRTSKSACLARYLGYSIRHIPVRRLSGNGWAAFGCRSFWAN